MCVFTHSHCVGKKHKAWNRKDERPHKEKRDVIKNRLVHTSEIYLTESLEKHRMIILSIDLRRIIHPRLDLFISRKTLRLALNRHPCALCHSRRTVKQPKFGFSLKKNEHNPRGSPTVPSSCMEHIRSAHCYSQWQLCGWTPDCHVMKWCPRVGFPRFQFSNSQVFHKEHEI